MRFSIIYIFISISLSCFSQGTVLKEFDNGEFIPYGHQFSGNNVIPTYNSVTDIGRILNAELNPLSEFNITGNFTYNIYALSYLSQYVFNSDDNYEFIISGSDPSGVTTTLLMNDKGEILQDYGEHNVFLISLNSKNYLIKRKSDFDVSITPPQLKHTDELITVPGKFRKLEY